MLARGEVDVMGGLIKTAQRQKIIDFVEPPYMTPIHPLCFTPTVTAILRPMKLPRLYAKRIAVMRGWGFTPALMTTGN